MYLPSTCHRTWNPNKRSPTAPKRALNCGESVEPMTGIEPAYSAWEADVLPLNYTRVRLGGAELGDDYVLGRSDGVAEAVQPAEHRVRVLISRVRDLLGDPAAIERVRDAGEHGKTRYRLSPGVRFALIEPLYTS